MEESLQLSEAVGREACGERDGVEFDAEEHQLGGRALGLVRGQRHAQLGGERNGRGEQSDALGLSRHDEEEVVHVVDDQADAQVVLKEPV